VWRDGWAWAALLGLLPLVLHSLGAPLGEPVAEDFDFLRRALLTSDRSLLDGGGSLSFWRPLSHQLYYLTLGPLIVSHPRAVAAIHAALLAAATLLLYRAMRRSWPGHMAAAAAAFPLLAESTRTLIAWPSHFVDLGLFVFSALAIHEAAARRLGTALGALLGALLCKEVAIVTALLLPWWPGHAAMPRRERARWAIASGALMALWAAAYLWVRAHAHLVLPHDLESDPAIRSTALQVRLAWGTWNSLRAIVSLPLVGTKRDAIAAALVALVGAAAAIRLAVSRGARARAAHAGAWIAWGAAWFALASATLAAIYPLWQPNRSQFGSVGLGLAAIALLDAAAPALVAAMLAARLVTFALAPGPPARITREAPETGAFMDFERLARLQRLMRDTRTALARRHPRLPRGAAIGQHDLPLAAEYAFGGPFALQVWYRDTTLRWVRFEDFSAGRGPEPLTIVEFEPLHSPQVTLVETEAMRSLLDGIALTTQMRYAEALAPIAHGESVLVDTNARVFRGAAAATRASALAGLGRTAEAELEARRAVRLFPSSAQARLLLGAFDLAHGRLESAEAELDTMLMIEPRDSVGRSLRERVRAARAATR
jgi:hypothetical protein